MKKTSLILSILAVPLAGCPSDDSSSDETGGTDGTAGTTTTAPGTTTGTTTGTSGTTTTDPTATSEAPTVTTDDATGPTQPPTSSDSTDVSGSVSTGSGSESGSESSGSTGNENGIADLDMTLVIQQTADSVFTQTIDATEASCAFQDGCLTATGARRLLRFDTITPNVGDADFYAGNAMDNPELFAFSTCQGQFLLTDYAQYRLLDTDGNVVANGHKSAFALIDLVPWSDDAGPAQYGFNGDMGISVGWSDVYSSGLDCQWVDITDVAPGDYLLELAINSLELIPEATFENNTIQIPVTID